MTNHDLTVWLVNVLVLVAILFTGVVAGLWIRGIASPRLVWSVILSGWASVIYCLVSLGLEFLALRGSTACESLSVIVNRPASVLIGWMAYEGTGWIDKPLTADQILVLKCGAALWFWLPFAVILLFGVLQRRLPRSASPK